MYLKEINPGTVTKDNPKGRKYTLKEAQDKARQMYNYFNPKEE